MVSIGTRVYWNSAESTVVSVIAVPSSLLYIKVTENRTLTFLLIACYFENQFPSPPPPIMLVVVGYEPLIACRWGGGSRQQVAGCFKSPQ